jgi:hypothetical protein
MAHTSLSVDLLPIDQELCDPAQVGPELSQLASIYLTSPRALVWRNPSSDWKLFTLLLPIGSRLSLLSNPIFTHLTRAWGMNIRFVGVDSHGRVFDFKALLSDHTLSLLTHWLGLQQRRNLLGTAMQASADMGNTANNASREHGLDVLFEALASEMLTMNDARRFDWYKHLDCEHRLEPLAPNSLFDREARFPDFIAQLHVALKADLIDLELYGRILRSIDLREQAIEQRMAMLIEGSLHAPTLSQLGSTKAGIHLGCYNWLLMSPKHSAARTHALLRLPGFASYLAATLTPMAALEEAGQIPLGPAVLLQRAIDAGQDRLIIQTLAQNFGASENTIRRLWRDTPRAIGQPPVWQMTEVVQQLDDLPARDWPNSLNEWQRLLGRSVPNY